MALRQESSSILRTLNRPVAFSSRALKASPAPKRSRLLALKQPFSTHRKMTEKIVPVHTPESVAPIGPYSQAVKANGLVFVSGMIPATKDGKLVEGSVSEQTHQMCRNAQAVLEAAGSGLEKAVKITVFFANLDDFAEMNGVYAEYFPHRPARSAIEAKRLPAGVSMEMDIIAIEEY